MSNGYYNVYFQEDKDNGWFLDPMELYGVYCMEEPFKYYPSVKEPVKRSWHDENGDDEYIPPDGLKIEAYEIKVKFGMKMTEEEEQVDTGPDAWRDFYLDFINELLHYSPLRMYSEFNMIGRRGVRVKEIETNFIRPSYNKGLMFVFTITFKVNDPVTSVGPLKDKDGKVTKLVL